MSVSTKIRACVAAFFCFFGVSVALAVPCTHDCLGELPIGDEEDPPVAGEQQADIRVSHSVTAAARVFGDPVRYKIEIWNDGPDVAVGALVGHSLSVAYDVATLPSNCNGDGTNITCQLGDMPAGDYQQVRLNLAPRVSGEVFSTAHANSQTPDPRSLNNSATVGTDYPVEKLKCCTCMQGGPAPIAACADVAANRGCDHTVEANWSTTPNTDYAKWMCNSEFQNLECESHEFIINNHGLPAGFKGGIAAIEFEAVMKAVKQNCEADRDWCDGPFSYTGNFCFSAEDIASILEICRRIRLPEDCSFSFYGNQSFCTWDDEGLHPYDSPATVVYEPGGCKVKFASCDMIAGQQCAFNPTDKLKLQFKYGDTVYCADRNGLTKVAECQFHDIEGGSWTILPDLTD